MSVEHIDKTNFDQVISGEKTVLVDFFATWCGPCKMQAPILDAISETLEESRQIVKVDVDENPEIASRYGIMSIPTLVVFESGKVKAKAVGVHTKEQVLELFE